jgi:hypothetical protein
MHTSHKIKQALFNHHNPVNWQGLKPRIDVLQSKDAGLTKASTRSPFEVAASWSLCIIIQLLQNVHMKQNRINKFQTEYRRKPHSLLHLNKEAIKLDSCSFSCPAQKASIPFFGTDLVNRDDFIRLRKLEYDMEGNWTYQLVTKNSDSFRTRELNRSNQFKTHELKPLRDNSYYIT